MELDELHVHQRRAGFERQRRAVAVVLLVARGVAVIQRGGATRRQDDVIRLEEDELAALHVVAGRPVDAVAVREQPRDHHVVAVGNFERLGPVDERIEHRLARAVTDEAGPAERLRAEVALIDLAVFGPIEGHPPVIEFPDAVGHMLGRQLDRSRVVDEVAFVQRIGGVNRPVVLGVERSQRGVDAAGRPGRVCVAVVPLADDQRFDTVLASPIATRAPAAPAPTTSTGTDTVS